MIREGRESDAPAAVRLLNCVYPSWAWTEAGFRHRMRSEAPRAQRRYWAAEDDARLVAWANAGLNTETDRDDVGWLQIGVDPEYLGRGIGSALYERAESHLVTHRVRRFLTSSPDEDASRRFLERRGFRHTLTGKVSRLDVRSADRNRLAALREQKAREGFDVVPLSAFRARPREIYELDVEVSADVPADEPMTNVRFDEWEEQQWRSPDVSWDGSFVVVDAEGRPVSFAVVLAYPEFGRAMNGITGTARAFRGRGLARLAKLATIAWAAESGISEIVTGNDDTNAPMLALNVDLGYRPFAREFSFVRDVE